MMYKADSTGIYYHTAKFKPLYRQIMENRSVEICFNSQDAQVRVEGIVEILYDDKLKKEMLAERPYLQPLIDHGGKDALVAFRITGCRAAVWTPETNLEPTRYIDI
jgi:pyridoxamine 5'-phosphate oxidase